MAKKKARKKSPVIGAVWLYTRDLHLAWRRYPMTLCGKRIEDKEEALARGGERKERGYRFCSACIEAQNLLTETMMEDARNG